MSEKRGAVIVLPAAALPTVVSTAGYSLGIPVPDKTGDTCTGARDRTCISGSSGGHPL